MILDSGENFRFGRKFWVWVKILGLGKKLFGHLGLVENLGFGRKFWFWVKNLGLGENCRFG